MVQTRVTTVHLLPPNSESKKYSQMSVRKKMVLQGERKTRNGSLNERYKNLSPPGVVSSRKNEEKNSNGGDWS
jgi:hypothetical protein